MIAADFDLKALFAALDHQRDARGLTWPAAAREIAGALPSALVRPVASSTIRRLATRPLAEADGVLQMLRWLGRTPESFIRGVADHSRLPEVPPSRVLRFDTRTLHAAVDEQRKARGLTWQQAADESRVSPSHLRTLASGGRTAFPYVTRLTRWLGKPAANFMHATRY